MDIVHEGRTVSTQKGTVITIYVYAISGQKRSYSNTLSLIKNQWSWEGNLKL